MPWEKDGSLTCLLCKVVLGKPKGERMATILFEAHVLHSCPNATEGDKEGILAGRRAAKLRG